MGKQRHLNASQILMNAQIDAYIKAEVQRQMESTTMDERVVNAIKATHEADVLLDLMVFLDFYEADPEWCKQFLETKNELLHQYNDGTVQLKQMKEHVKIRAGIDVEKLAQMEMEFADIKVSETA